LRLDSQAPEEAGAMTHDRRKADHIRINLEEQVQFPHLTSGLEHYRFMHQAVPELDLAAVKADLTALMMASSISAITSSPPGFRP
jgi:isopentenyl-diphosphate delta-isomerase